MKEALEHFVLKFWPLSVGVSIVATAVGLFFVQRSIEKLWRIASLQQEKDQVIVDLINTVNAKVELLFRARKEMESGNHEIH